MIIFTTYNIINKIIMQNKQQQGGSRKRKASRTKKSKKTCPTNKHRNRTTKKCRCKKICK